jgi:hypothetical protein
VACVLVSRDGSYPSTTTGRSNQAKFRHRGLKHTCQRGRGVKFQESFTSEIYFRAKVSNITSRVNYQGNSSKGRNTKVTGTSRNCRYCRGNGRSKLGNIGRILVGSLFTSKSRTGSLAGILELLKLSIFGWGELGVLVGGVVLELDGRDLVNLVLRKEAL